MVAGSCVEMSLRLHYSVLIEKDTSFPRLVAPHVLDTRRDNSAGNSKADLNARYLLNNREIALPQLEMEYVLLPSLILVLFY